MLGRRLDLFGRELIAVDGTRTKAVNSGKRNFTKAKFSNALARAISAGAQHRSEASEENRSDPRAAKTP